MPTRIIRRTFATAINPLEITLAILKPDVTALPCICSHIKQSILDNGLYFVRSKEVRLSLSDAEKFYAEHRERYFFQRLTHFMTSGSLSVHILTGDDVISRWRKLIGSTKVLRTQFEDPTSFRGSFGVTDTRNVCHGSDSLETAAKEVAFFFPDFNYNKWVAEDSIYFKESRVSFDDERCTHVPNKR